MASGTSREDAEGCTYGRTASRLRHVAVCKLIEKGQIGTTFGDIRPALDTRSIGAGGRRPCVYRTRSLISRSRGRLCAVGTRGLRVGRGRGSGSIHRGPHPTPQPSRATRLYLLVPHHHLQTLRSYDSAT